MYDDKSNEKKTGHTLLFFYLETSNDVFLFRERGKRKIQNPCQHQGLKNI